MSEGMLRVNNGQTEVLISAVRKSKVALRDVARQSAGYLQLVESVRAKGVLQPVIVREVVDEEGKQAFGLIDGLQRFTASQDAGLEWIPCVVKSMDDAEVLDAQIIANLHRIETKPKEYTEQLLRILASNPLMTEKELAAKLCVSDAFIAQRLSLTKLSAPIMELVQNERINLTNAYALAKLPEEEQAEFVDRAQTEQPKVFIPLVATRAKALRDAKYQGRDAKPAEFAPVPTLRKIKDVKAEFESFEAGKTIISLNSLSDPLQVWKAAVEWVLGLDSNSVAVQRAKYEESKRLRDEAKEKRKAEREEAKAKLAAETVADVTTL